MSFSTQENSCTLWAQINKNTLLQALITAFAGKRKSRDPFAWLLVQFGAEQVGIMALYFALRQ